MTRPVTRMSDRKVPVTVPVVLAPLRDWTNHVCVSRARGMLEFIIALLALILLSPPLVILMLLIRLDSPGPAIFRQVRLGKDLKPFVFYKFRTMYRDAAQRFPELYNYEKAGHSMGEFLFKQQEDPRLTRVGRVLRRTGLDELPNLINVLQGDCALVGPRPEIPDMLSYYTESQRVRFQVQQGLVCLAQVRGANRLTFTQTANLDAEYAQKRSLGLDISILARVIPTILRGDLH